MVRRGLHLMTFVVCVLLAGDIVDILAFFEMCVLVRSTAVFHDVHNSQRRGRPISRMLEVDTL